MSIADFKAYLEAARDRAEADVHRCQKVGASLGIIRTYYGRADAFWEVLNRLDMLED